MKTERLQHAYEKIEQKLFFWLDHIFEMIPNYIIAILIIVGAFLFSKFIGKLLLKGLNRFSKNEVINELSSRAVRLIIMILGIFLALGILHLDKTVTSLLAGVGILGLGLSFAFQHTAANILSGIIISVRGNINVGDLIKSNEYFGNILRVGLRTIRVLNVYGQEIEIPNRLVLDNAHELYSRTGYRRIDIDGQLKFDLDLTNIKETVEREMLNVEGLYAHKNPSMIYTGLNKEKVTFKLRVWINFTNNDAVFQLARSKVIEQLQSTFKALDVPLARAEMVYYKHEVQSN